MKIERRDGSRERKIVTALIVDPTVLGRIASLWGKVDLFSSKWANLIAGWCVSHWQRYGKPPGRHVRGIFEQWVESNKDEATQELIERYLETLSSEYEQNPEDTNSAHLLDLAGEHFSRVKLTRLAESIQAELDAGQIARAEACVTEHSKIEVGVGAGVDLFCDEEAVRSTFSHKEDTSIVTYPGDLDLFFDGALERDGLVAFAGAEKQGKSFWLLDIAWRAMLQRRKVAYFQVGDLSERQIKQRLLIRAALAPFRSPTKQWPFSINYPVNITVPKKAAEEKHITGVVENKVKTFKEALSYRVAWEACTKVTKAHIKSKNSHFKLSCHPNTSVSVLGIKSILEGWQLQDWHADVVVIDYSDILAPVDKREEKRDQVNTTWNLMRTLSQTLHCLVVTGTQIKASGYNKWVLDRSDFSEDKRKLAHCTAMFGINVTPTEKERGIARLNWIVGREREFSNRRCCHVAGCLALASPAVRSVYPFLNF